MRKVVVWLHRWVGLAMALFLLVEGTSGALLAFRGPLTRLLDPALFSTAPVPGSKPLDLASLIEAAERIEPQRRFHWFLPIEDGVALLYFVPKDDAGDAGAKPIYLALDPWTGREVRRMDADLFGQAGVLANVMPFVYLLHKTLALGGVGGWILAATALLWSLDSLWAVYLTLPRGSARFWPRWKPAWLIKWRARWPRVNYDVHRATSLWVWLPLLLFAWSSVELIDSFTVYDRTMQFLLGPADNPTLAALDLPARPVAPPRLGWHEALARGQQLADAMAARDGYALEAPNSIWYLDGLHQYSIRFRTTRVFPRDRDLVFYFDGDSGAQGAVIQTTSGNANATASTWLVAGHLVTDPFDYLAYRWLVCLLGLLLSAIATTGVVIWVAKRRAR